MTVSNEDHPTVIASRKHILFLDDQPAFLETAQEIFESFSDGFWSIHLAQDSSQALQLMEQFSMDLVVVDLVMPVMDGSQFLTLIQQKYPDVPRVILTGHPSTEARKIGLDRGASLFLEKPTQIGQFRTIYVALNELAALHSQKGFRGLLRQVGLTDVIQMECLARNSSILELHSQGIFGRIFIKEGTIIHAEAADDVGEQALARILGLPGGKFNLRPFKEPEQLTIEGQWEFLIMEAARRADEMAGAALAELREPEPAPSSLPDKGPDKMANEAPTHPRSGNPLAGALAQTKGVAPRAIQTILVWAPTADHLLYAGPHQDLRRAEDTLRLVDRIAAEADLVGPLLHLGRFLGLETSETTERLALRMRSDSRVWVQGSSKIANVWERAA